MALHLGSSEKEVMDAYKSLFNEGVPLMRESVLKSNEKGRKALLSELVEKF